MQDPSWDDGTYDKFKKFIKHEEEEENFIEEEEDEFAALSSNSGSSDEKLGMKRILLVILVLPSLVYCVVAVNDIVTKYSLTTKWLHILAVVAGGAAATIAVLRFQVLRGSIFLVIPVAAAVMVLPTYQVYSCSPLYIVNSNFGKDFKLKTDAPTVLEKSYVSSTCFKALSLQTPLSMSIHWPTISLQVEATDLIDLLTESGGANQEYMTLDDDQQPAKKGSHKFFLARSFRTVKGKLYKVCLLLKVPVRIENVDTIAHCIKNSAQSRGLVLTGQLKNLDKYGEILKKRFTSKHYLIRPIMLVISKIFEPADS